MFNTIIMIEWFSYRRFLLQVFEYVLIMLAAVLVSNLINRFIPVLSVPLVQIVLGATIALIPFGAFGFNFHLEPELFFVLFLAPLVFYSSMTLSKRAFWEMKGQIFSTALILVFLTVIIAGYIVHGLLPAIPLAASFAMIAALGPTDVVAVSASTRRVSIPQKIMGVLSGESLINDASGIVSFQFAIMAMTTGSFSISNATGSFLLLSLGGVIAGLVITVLKTYLEKWLRSLGIENITFHILIDILTPFIIYMIAEALNLSGILAVFAAGIAHSLLRERLNPETVRLNIARESVWSTVSFSFDGLVFVILGTQLPGIITKIGDEFSLIEWRLIVYIILLTLFIALVRFAWWTLIIGRTAALKPDSGAGQAYSNIRAGIVFSLAGARGTVSLACVMSIPLTLADGTPFPGRDLIIFLAGGVIIASLLLTNFALPLFADRKSGQKRSEEEQAAYAEIIQTVITNLLAESTDENRFATQTVIRSYSRRNVNPKESETVRQETVKERDLLLQAREWEKEHIAEMLRDGTIDEDTANHYLEAQAKRYGTQFSLGKRVSFRRFIMVTVMALSGKRRHDQPPEDDALSQKIFELMTANNKYVLDKLNAMKTDENGAVDKLISWYELSSQVHQNRAAARVPAPQDNETMVPAQPDSTARTPAQPDSAARTPARQDSAARGLVNTTVFEVAMRGFEIERELIQSMFEEGRLSRETAKEMRGNISLLEARLQNG